jgi:predicted ABC-type ATPase
MFNVCPRCGEDFVEKVIDASGPFAICPACRYAHRFLQLPLFIITGASGSGKTTVGQELLGQMQECVILESDILWGTVPATPENAYREYRELWLRLAKNIGQNGRPVVLFGTAIPEQFEACADRRYFSTLHYLAMVCDDDLIAERLRQRPAWRKSGTTAFIQEMIQFNRWLKAHADATQPPMTLYDTSHRAIAETASNVARWIRERL